MKGSEKNRSEHGKQYSTTLIKSEDSSLFSMSHIEAAADRAEQVVHVCSIMIIT